MTKKKQHHEDECPPDEECKTHAEAFKAAGCPDDQCDELAKLASECGIPPNELAAGLKQHAAASPAGHIDPSAFRELFEAMKAGNWLGVWTAINKILFSRE